MEIGSNPAVLNLTALAMMALEVFGLNPYSDLPEHVSGCIVLFNTGDAPIASIFVATSKVPHLHVALGPRPKAWSVEVDNIIQDVNRQVETGQCDVGGIHATIRSYQKEVGTRVILKHSELERFGEWLDGVGDQHQKEHIRWIRPDGGNSISRETCLVLILTEYCIHQARRQENRRPANVTRGWRTQRQSGMVGNATQSIYGDEGGIDGFSQAHAMICSLIGAENDSTLAAKLSEAAANSGRPFDVGKAWDEALDNADTTFMAMYAFYTRWFATYGSIGGQVLRLNEKEKASLRKRNSPNDLLLNFTEYGWDKNIIDKRWKYHNTVQRWDKLLGYLVFLMRHLARQQSYCPNFYSQVTHTHRLSLQCRSLKLFLQVGTSSNTILTLLDCKEPLEGM